MKQLLISIGILALLASCTKESTPTSPVDQNIEPGPTTVLRDSGFFMNGPYGTVTGVAKVYNSNGLLQVQLADFNTTNGPDLKVYLSKEKTPVNFVNLGALQSTSGNQLYTIPTGVDPAAYPYVLIHCQQYNHLFGYAERKP